MNKILQKRIRKAAIKNLEKNQGKEFNSVSEEQCFRVYAFEDGVNWALQNQWIPVGEALPECDRCCLAMYEDGGIIVAKYEDRDWWWQDGFVVGRNTDGDLMYSSSCKVPSGLITHWMMIPTINKEEK